MRKAFLVAIALVAVLSLDLWVHGPVAASLLARAHRSPPHALEHAFWDAEPYAAGIADYRAGRSPYHSDDLANPLPFVYPPAFVWTGSALAKAFPSPWGSRLYIFIYLASVFGLQMLLGALFLRRPISTEWLVALCLLPLAPFLSTAFLSGNIHAIWYFLGALAAIPGIRRNQWAWFVLVVAFAMLNQPILAVMLLVPLFVGSRQYLASAATLISVACGYMIEKALNPGMYQQFQQTITAHLAVSNDFGQGIFGLSERMFTSVIAAGLAQGLFTWGVLVVMIRLKSRGVANDRRWWALVTLSVVLISPRIMPYDAAIGLIPAIFFLIYTRKWCNLAILPAVAACVLWHGTVGFTPLVLAGFIVGAFALARAPEPSSLA